MAATAADVPLAEVVTLPHEGQRLGPVQVRHAFGEDMAVDGAALFDIDVHTSDGVGHPFEPLEPDHRHVVDLDSEHALQGLDEQGRSTEGEGRVDLVASPAGDRDIEVSWEVDQCDVVPILRDVHQHDDVGPGPSETRSGIGAEQQVVVSRALRRDLLGGRRVPLSRLGGVDVFREGGGRPCRGRRPTSSVAA